MLWDRAPFDLGSERLPRVLRLPLEIAQVLGHTSTGQAPGWHPDSLLATLGIIAESGWGRSAERGVLKDP